MLQSRDALLPSPICRARNLYRWQRVWVVCPLIKSVGLGYWIQKIHLQPDAVKLIFTLLPPYCFLSIHLIFLNFSSLPCFSLLLTLYLSLTSFISSSLSLSRSLDQNGGSRGGRDNSQSSGLLPGGKCDTAMHCTASPIIKPVVPSFPLIHPFL